MLFAAAAEDSADSTTETVGNQLSKLNIAEGSV